MATIAEFDTDCDEESSVEGELDCVRKPSAVAGPGRRGTDSASGGRTSERPKHQGACGGEADGAPPLDNVRSPQNANVPLSQTTDINLNPPSGARVMRARARSPADKLGNHLPSHRPGVPRGPGQGDETTETTAFKHNLFPTLDFIDEFAD